MPGGCIAFTSLLFEVGLPLGPKLLPGGGSSPKGVLSTLFDLDVGVAAWNVVHKPDELFELGLCQII